MVVVCMCIWIVLGPSPVEAKVVFTLLLAFIGRALIKHVLNPY
jgi:hypothetical protein